MVFEWLRKTARHRLPGGRPGAEAPPIDEARLEIALNEADAHLSAGQLDRADAALAPMLARNPRSARLYVLAGASRTLRHQPDDALPFLHQAVELDPKNALAWEFLAANHHRLGEPLRTLDAAARALALAPSKPVLHNLAGVALMNLGRAQEALAAFHRTIDLDANNLDAWANLESLRGHVMGAVALDEPAAVERKRQQLRSRLGRKFQAGSLSDQEAGVLLALTKDSSKQFPAALGLARAIATRPNLGPNECFALASVFVIAGDLPNCRRAFERALEIAPKSRDAAGGLGIALILAGRERWREGWQRGVEFAHHTHSVAYVRSVPEWEGQPLPDGRILIYQEQGIGDTLLALRLLPLVARLCREVVLWVDPKVADVAASAPGYTRLDRSPERPDPVSSGCTYAAPLVSLIPILDVAPEAIPPPPVLTAPADRIAKWADALASVGPGRRIGIAISGNPRRVDDWQRSVPAAALAPLQELHGAKWINLSVDPQPERDAAIKLLRMADPTGSIRDFADTAALIAQLDAVVAIDSVVGHLAASLGKPTWVLVPTKLDWRWSVREGQIAWWPTVRLLRADAPGLWREAVRQLKAEVESFLAGGTAESSGHPNGLS